MSTNTLAELDPVFATGNAEAAAWGLDSDEDETEEEGRFF